MTRISSMNLPTSRKRAPALPTFAAFKRLPLKSRTKVFLTWVKAQPARKTYRYMDTRGCCLAQFGTALTGQPCEAGGLDFRTFIDPVQDLCVPLRPFHQVIPRYKQDCCVTSPPQGDISTFGALAKRIEQLL